MGSGMDAEARGAGHERLRAGVIGGNKPANPGDQARNQPVKRPRSFWLKFTIPGRTAGRSVGDTPIQLASVAAS